MERKGFIGGSDCVKIMQGNWLELWQIKTGLVESDDLSRNLAVQLGSYTEDFNLEWFEIEYDCILSNLQHEYELQIGTVPATVKPHCHTICRSILWLAQYSHPQ